MVRLRKMYVYILANHKRSVFYTGVTGNIECRIRDHKSGKGGVFTSKYKCFYLMYLEEFDNPRSAISREKQLKKWLRPWKIALIGIDNPDMRDLAEEW